MKTLLLLLLSILPALGRDLTFAWDPNPEPDVVQYRLETSSAASGAPWVSGGVTANTELEIKKLPNAVLFVRAFAINAAGLESEPSEILRVDPDKPSAPGKPRIKIVLQSSVDLKQWQEIASVVKDAGPREFFRTSIQPLP